MGRTEWSRLSCLHTRAPGCAGGPSPLLIAPSPASDASLRVAASLSASLAQSDVGAVVPFPQVPPFFSRSDKQSATGATLNREDQWRRARLLLRRRENGGGVHVRREASAMACGRVRPVWKSSAHNVNAQFDLLESQKGDKKQLAVDPQVLSDQRRRDKGPSVASVPFVTSQGVGFQNCLFYFYYPMLED